MHDGGGESIEDCGSFGDIKCKSEKKGIHLVTVPKKLKMQEQDLNNSRKQQYQIKALIESNYRERLRSDNGSAVSPIIVVGHGIAVVLASTLNKVFILCNNIHISNNK
jgi:hypothetical protein